MKIRGGFVAEVFKCWFFTAISRFQFQETSCKNLAGQRFFTEYFPAFPHSSPFRHSSILIYLLPRKRAVNLTRQNVFYSWFLSWKLYL